MTFRKDDFYTIQKEPAFSNFGRENLTELLNAWQSAGRKAVERAFNEIFSDGWRERQPKQEVISIVSGDGETPETAIRFSTGEMLQRIRMEFCYVYYTFGKGWDHMHSTVLGDNGKTYSHWSLDLPDGRRKQIYFDTNRSE